MIYIKSETLSNDMFIIKEQGEENAIGVVVKECAYRGGRKYYVEITTKKVVAIECAKCKRILNADNYSKGKTHGARNSYCKDCYKDIHKRIKESIEKRIEEDTSTHAELLEKLDIANGRILELEALLEYIKVTGNTMTKKINEVLEKDKRA